MRDENYQRALFNSLRLTYFFMLVFLIIWFVIDMRNGQAPSPATILLVGQIAVFNLSRSYYLKKK